MAGKIQILVADNQPDALYGMLADWGYSVVMANDGLEALALLRAEDGPRIAVLDSKLPGLTGAEVCRRVRAANQLKYVYLMLLSEAGPVEDLAAAIDAGADDYLPRPFHLQEFRARLQAGRRIVEAQQRLISAHEELYQQAKHDSLTGLWNRTAILEILDREIARANRSGTGVAVIMADIDHFKPINDGFGHIAGDAVLREATHRMSAVLRKYDSIGRFGGEEFLIIIPGSQPAGSLAAAGRLREAVACQPYFAGGAECRVTCSFGLSWSDCRGNTDADQMLREADAASTRPSGAAATASRFHYPP